MPQLCRVCRQPVAPWRRGWRRPTTTIHRHCLIRKCRYCGTWFTVGKEQLVAYAKARGLATHMGRVNSKRRLHYAERIGCDSIDGLCFSRWPNRKIPKALAWIQPLPLFRERKADVCR